MTVEALRGSEKPFQSVCTRCGRTRASRRRPQPCAALLADSKIVPSHANCTKVQDAYSLRLRAAGARRQQGRHPLRASKCS
jgi:histidine ammonia-lyase